MKKKYILNMSLRVFYLFIVVAVCESANILAVFPTPSISHQVVFRPITLELAKRGHNITVVTADPMFNDGNAPENYTEVDLHDISYAYKGEMYLVSKHKDVTIQRELMFDIMSRVCETQLQNKEFAKLIKNRHTTFDVLLLEAYFRPILALTHIFKVPTVLISSFGTFDQHNNALGSSVHPVLYPTSVFFKKVHNHSFMDRMKAVYNQFTVNNIIKKSEKKDTEMLRKYFGDDLPSLNELNNNIDMLLLNVHPMWEGNRPVPPNVIYMGGLPNKPHKELPADIQSYLNSSEHGVIYMSFGTNVSPSLLPTERVQTFMRVFSKLPYNVLWKWDNDEVPGNASNVRFGKWFPQSDLLKHPKMKLFITQGGLQSTDEAIVGGVPLLCIPMLGDQFFNGDRYVQLGIGKHIDLEEIEEQTLMDAINTVISDESYRSSMKRVRAIMSDQPQSALDRAVFWIEYTARHGGARHLRPAGANMPWHHYYQCDVLAVAALAAIALCYTFYIIMKCLFTIKLSSKLKVN